MPISITVSFVGEQIGEELVTLHPEQSFLPLTLLYTRSNANNGHQGQQCAAIIRNHHCGRSIYHDLFQVLPTFL